MGNNPSATTSRGSSAASIRTPRSSDITVNGLKVDDVVKITLDEEIVRECQRGHGGWVDEMKNVLNQPGKILRFDDSQDAVVKFENGRQFVFNVVLLEKIRSEPKPVVMTQISLGDLIRIEMSEARVRQLQTGSMGYNPEMKTCLGKVAYVRGVPNATSVRAKSGPRSWTWSRQCVTRLSEADLKALLTKNQSDRTFLINDFVLIDSNLARVKRLQEGHGDWVDSMQDTLGKYGYVKRVLDDGDLRVKVHGRTWTYNPEVVKKIVPSRDSNSTIQQQSSDVDAGAILLRLLAALASDDDGSTMTAPEAVKAGNLGRLQQLKRDNKLDVNEKHDGHALIEIACAVGKFNIVEWLIDENCDIHVRDSDGDQAIHEAALFGHPNIVRYLIRKGADPNSPNNRQITPLHWAVNKGFLMVVQVLLDCGANINAQDEQGDTPLHDAIHRDATEIAKLLIQKKADISLVNKRGFNAIHWMALKDRHQLLEFTLETREEVVNLVNVAKEDGFTALHLAALNNYSKTCQVLCQFPATEVNCVTNSGQTPLHVATINRSKDALQTLMGIDAVDINVKDADGDSALHEAVRLFTLGQLSGFQEIIASAIGVTTPSVSHPEEYVEIAKLLARHGADINLKNNSQNTPIGLCLDSTVADELRRSATEFSASQSTRPRGSISRAPGAVLQRISSTDETISGKNFSTTPASSSSNVETAARNTARVSKKESDEEILRVHKELNELKQKITCPICMERPFHYIFQCGHGTCEECATRITDCPICRSKISTRTVLHGLH